MDCCDGFEKLCMLVAGETSCAQIESALIGILDMNAKDNEGHTPLWYAAVHNPSVAVIRILMEAGAQADFPLLCEAIVRNPNPEVPIHIYQALKPLDQQQLDHAFLMAAASNPNDRLIRFFQKEGADINAQLPMDIYPSTQERFDYGDCGDSDGVEEDDSFWLEDNDPVMQNALVVAIYENQDPASMVVSLLEMGVYADAIDSEGNSVLMHALDNLYVVKALIAGGVDVDIPDVGGSTPLMLACEAENDEVSLELIKAGANVNAVSHFGENALHRALICHVNDNSKVIQALIDAGVDVNTPDGEGLTPLRLARINYAVRPVLAVLEKAGATLGGDA